MPRSSLKAPFLNQISLRPGKFDADVFPFNRFPTLLGAEFSMEFKSPVTMFVGENGSGKATILQSISELAGFHSGGGTANFQLFNTSNAPISQLAQALHPSWLPKVSRGFFSARTLSGKSRDISTTKAAHWFTRSRCGSKATVGPFSLFSRNASIINGHACTYWMSPKTRFRQCARWLCCGC